MKRTLKICSVALLLPMGLCVTAFSQPNPQTQNGAVQLMWNRGTSPVLDSSATHWKRFAEPAEVRILLETRVDPPTPPVGGRFSTSADVDSKGVISSHHAGYATEGYFRYDVVVEVLPNLQRFRVTFQQPASGSTASKSFSSWTSLPAPCVSTPAKDSCRRNPRSHSVIQPGIESENCGLYFDSGTHRESSAEYF
jgi:hypothetical protein